MKWIWTEKFEHYKSIKYWRGRKNGASIQIYFDEKRGYDFYVNREKDRLAYNSLWTYHPNPIAPLIGRYLNMPQEDIFDYVEEWIDLYVPKLKKEEKNGSVS